MYTVTFVYSKLNIGWVWKWREWSRPQDRDIHWGIYRLLHDPQAKARLREIALTQPVHLYMDTSTIGTDAARKISRLMDLAGLPLYLWRPKGRFFWPASRGSWEFLAYCLSMAVILFILLLTSLAVPTAIKVHAWQDWMSQGQNASKIQLLTTASDASYIQKSHDLLESMPGRLQSLLSSHEGLRFRLLVTDAEREALMTTLSNYPIEVQSEIIGNNYESLDVFLHWRKP